MCFRSRLFRAVPVFGVLFSSALYALPPRHELQRLVDSSGPQPAAPLEAANAVHQMNASGPYASLKVSMLSRVSPQSFSTNTTCTSSPTNSCANDIWGYVSPSGREYAILGLRSGTGFVDVTDPVNPVVVGAIADANSLWSDMRTYQTYGYNVNESGGGLQVFDLSQIDPPTRQVSLVRSVTQSGLNTVHNLTLNVDSGYLYLCGSNLAGGRLVAVSLADPSNPVIVGQMQQSVYVHDAQVVSYTEGPYAGREIAFCFCGSGGFRIVDVTNKANMFTMATLHYPNRTYCHQGGLSTDRRHVFIDDELDELQNPNVSTTTTYVVNVENLTAPFFVSSFTSGMPSIDHNLFVKGDFVFEANYTSGMRIFNVSDVFNVEQVGWFDSYPLSSAVSFDGNWGVYPFLPSGNVIISDQYGGLFVLDVSEATASPCESLDAPQAEANPFPRNRYVAFTPANPGEQTAVRVTLSTLPAAYSAIEGTEMWLDIPQSVVDAQSPFATIKRSRLSCDPVYHDWGSEGRILIADREIVPGGIYQIQQLGLGCDTGSEVNYTVPLEVAATHRWGDLVGQSYILPPNDDTNFIDISGVVDRFRNQPDAPPVSSADLSPGRPDGIVDFTDVSLCVDAFRGLPLPFSLPSGCP